MLEFSRSPTSAVVPLKDVIGVTFSETSTRKKTSLSKSIADLAGETSKYFIIHYFVRRAKLVYKSIVFSTENEQRSEEIVEYIQNALREDGINLHLPVNRADLE